MKANYVDFDKSLDLIKDLCHVKEVTKDIKKYFKYSGFFLTVVPSYIGGYMALVWASNNNNLLKTKNNAIDSNIKTTYFNKDILQASFAIPNFIKE